MTPQDFCYWLQGYYEMVGTYKLTDEQQKMVFEHHQLAFNKVTPTSIIKDSAPTKENNQFGCSVCQALGYKCGACSVFGYTFTGKDILLCGASINPNSNNTTTNSGLIENQYYKVNRALYAYSDPHGGSKTSTRIDDPFLLLGQRPVWYGESEPSYKIHILYNGKELHTEIQTRDINDFSIVKEPMISPWQDKVIEPNALKTKFNTPLSEIILEQIRRQDYMKTGLLTKEKPTPESLELLRAQGYCIIDLKGWQRDAAGQLTGPIISGSIMGGNIQITPSGYIGGSITVSCSNGGYGNGNSTNIPITLTGNEPQETKVECEYEEKHGYRCVNHKHLDKTEYQQITHQLIGVCPLMHPTCSQSHHSSDPHNTPEEREKLLAYENSKSVFNNAIPIRPGSEQHYRNIKCSMTC